MHNLIQSARFKFRAVQKSANLVDHIEKYRTMNIDMYLLASIGFDTAENEPRRIWCMITAGDLVLAGLDVRQRQRLRPVQLRLDVSDFRA